MKAGTVDPPIKTVPPRRWARSRFSGGGSNGGNGKNGGDGNDGGNDPRPDLTDSETFNPDKARIITWFLLLAVLMTFGGLIGAYVVLATNGAAEWQPFDLPVQVWISTALLLVSSITYEFARHALFADQFDRSRKFLIVTTGLGAAFISSQLLVWLALVNRGFYLRGNPYAGFFYILTAVHAIHVAGGIVALGTILLRTWNETPFSQELTYRRNLARSVGWYWHFMGGLWIVLFILLGFWK
jgi:cytochrome c oxidase subunit III